MSDLSTPSANTSSASTPTATEPAATASSAAASTATASSATAASPARRAMWLRIAALVALTVALVAIGYASGATEYLSEERIQAMMRELGALGFVAYLVVFAVGELIHVPGMAFVTAAMLAYGPWLGIAAGLAGASVSLTVSFYVVRLVGGQPLGEIQRPLLRRMLAHLDARPVLTIALLRLVVQLLPALNYALAMSRVRYRDYMLGSVLGMIPVIVVWAFAYEWIASLLR